MTPLDLSWELLGGFKAQVALTHGYQSIHCTADGRSYSWRLYIWLLSVRNPMVPFSQKNSQLCQSPKSQGASTALWPIGSCPELPSRRLGFVGCWGFFSCSSVGLGTILGDINTWWQHQAGHHILTLCHAPLTSYPDVHGTHWSHQLTIRQALSDAHVHCVWHAKCQGDAHLTRRARSMLFWEKNRVVRPAKFQTGESCV